MRPEKPPAPTYQAFIPAEQQLLNLYDTQAFAWLHDQLPSEMETASLPSEAAKLTKLYINVRRYRSKQESLKEYKCISNMEARIILRELIEALDPSGALGKRLNPDQARSTLLIGI